LKARIRAELWRERGSLFLLLECTSVCKDKKSEIRGWAGEAMVERFGSWSHVEVAASFSLRWFLWHIGHSVLVQASRLRY
jgi:hypothetical protein